MVSDKSKDGYIDSRHKSNTLCPEVNLLTGSVLFWNFLGNNVICLLATIFILTSIISSVVLAVYFSVKNYDRWKQYFDGKNVAAEPEVLPNVGSVAIPERASTLPPPTTLFQAPTAVASSDVKPAVTSLQVDHLNAYREPSLPQVQDSQSLPKRKLPKREESQNLAQCWQSDVQSNEIAAAGISDHKVHKTMVTTKRLGACKMIIEGASKPTEGVARRKTGRNRVSDPIYSQRDNSNTKKRRKVGTTELQKPRQQQLAGRSRYL